MGGLSWFNWRLSRGCDVYNFLRAQILGIDYFTNSFQCICTHSHMQAHTLRNARTHINVQNLRACTQTKLICLQNFSLSFSILTLSFSFSLDLSLSNYYKGLHTFARTHNHSPARTSTQPTSKFIRLADFVK